MDRCSRRDVLAGLATTVVASIAGCLGDDDTAEADVATDAWLPADAVTTDTTLNLEALDLHRAQNTWPDELQDDLDVSMFAAQFGVDPADIAGFLTMGVGDTGAFDDHTVLFGSFDPDTVVDALDPEEEPTEYGGYLDVGMVHVGDDAVVVSTAPETVIDARTGDADRAVDTDGDVADALDAAADAGLHSMVVEPDRAFDLLSVSMAYGDEAFDIEVRSYYPDEAAAEANYDDIEEELLADLDIESVDDVRVDGHRIVIEGHTSLETMLGGP